MFEYFPSETFSFLICQSIAFWHLRKFKHIFFSLKPSVLPSLNWAHDSALPKCIFLVVVTVLAILLLQQGQRWERRGLLVASVVPEMWPMVGHGHPKGMSSCENVSAVLVDVWNLSIAPAEKSANLFVQVWICSSNPPEYPVSQGRRSILYICLLLTPLFIGTCQS